MNVYYQSWMLIFPQTSRTLDAWQKTSNNKLGIYANQQGG